MLPKYQVVRSLMNQTLDPADVMRAFDIHTHLADLEPDAAAFVYRSRKNRYHIVVNQWLAQETQEAVFFHELYHIIEDMPQRSYVLGLDMQREEFETRADGFFREVMAVYAVE
ncbi:MAG: hypothetical protein K6U04_11490 [Armatimonadetes bacterium]|nr:hypothetical protein [Armatimonadota bacterium]